MVTVAARTTLAVALTFGLTACGAARSTSSSDSEQERSTVPGLAAAVMTHLDPDAVRNPNGTGNEYEKWLAVQMEVKVATQTVPLDVMVSELPEKARPPRAADACRGDESWVLTCRARTLDDGSVVVHMASTEDPVGGRFREGFMAYVNHYRDGQMVMVMESVRSRARPLVELERLPLDVTVLEEIATDPLVGVRTSAELNEAGKEVPGLQEG